MWLRQDVIEKEQKVICVDISIYEVPIRAGTLHRIEQIVNFGLIKLIQRPYVYNMCIYVSVKLKLADSEKF